MILMKGFVSLTMVVMEKKSNFLVITALVAKRVKSSIKNINLICNKLPLKNLVDLVRARRDKMSPSKNCTFCEKEPQS